jgi:hypothetical protein
MHNIRNPPAPICSSLNLASHTSCSAYGWCGDESHCEAGCQLDYGFCNLPTKISPDGSCGTVNSNDGFICPGRGYGDYCMRSLVSSSSRTLNKVGRIPANRGFVGSFYGWCGSSSGHCDGGCQTAYGTCNAQANVLTARDAWMSMVPVTREVASMTTLAATQAA